MSKPVDSHLGNDFDMAWMKIELSLPRGVNVAYWPLSLPKIALALIPFDEFKLLLENYRGSGMIRRRRVFVPGMPQAAAAPSATKMLSNVFKKEAGEKGGRQGAERKKKKKGRV